MTDDVEGLPTDSDELLERARYRVNNPSAWDSFDQGASDVIEELCTSLAALQRERDEAREQWHTNSAALTSMQQNRDTLQRHFNECTVRAEIAEAERDKLREAFAWVDTFDPETTAAAETKFGLNRFAIGGGR